MKPSRLTIVFTPQAAELAGLLRTGQRREDYAVLGMDDVLDLIERHHLIGRIEGRELVVRAANETEGIKERAANDDPPSWSVGRKTQRNAEPDVSLTLAS